MDTVALLNGLRFVDSFFPSGGYAYSSGLEAAVKAGAVRDGKDLAHYVEDVLSHGISPREARVVAIAHQAETNGKLEKALMVDRELDAMKLGHESRIASRQMGRQIIKVAAEQQLNSHLIRKFRAAIDEGRTPGHLPVSMGLTLAACGWSREDTVAAFFYQIAQGFVSAAMKLLPVGQQEGQLLLKQWSTLIAELSRTMTRQDVLVSWSPVQDIYAMQHARLESRLFRS
ncbi:MAG TPA: urease accessory UreF family protein [Nitrospiraceae bacterium]